MSCITSNIRRIWPLFLLPILASLVCACSTSHTPDQDNSNRQLRSNTPVVHSTDAPGVSLFENEIISLDYSNASSGYVSLTYKGENEKVKFQIQTPEQTTYTYLVSSRQEPVVFPLTAVSGAYVFTLLESVDVKEDLYAIVFQQQIETTIEDAFLPYLTPNIYTQFHTQSSCVVKGQELSENCYDDLDVIQNIYTFVTKNISYDEEKAKNISYGYIPSPDDTLSSGTGICFDYASLMTAMLRSQSIPTKLEVGYAGEIYHAWISCYVKEIGWVDNIIEFDGENWSLMDPTLAANNDRKNVQKYIGDGSKYIVKYTY